MDPCVKGITENASLKSMNTFGIDVSAERLVILRSDRDIAQCQAKGLFDIRPRLILGGGSNVLFTRDFKGLVIQPGFLGVEILKADDTHVWIRVGAGENWDGFVRRCLKNQWYGLENLVRIPGLVGASPIQNVGAYGVEIAPFFEELEAIDLATGRHRRFNRDACAFGYRTSRFKNEPKDRFLITAVTFRLLRSPRICIVYSALARELRSVPDREKTPAAVADAVDRIRQRVLPDPETIGNAGSFFKNPVLEAAEADTIRRAFPELPCYPAENGRIKVAAGWMIEQCGWKGRRVGRCGVYERQALVIVNHGGATGAEILDLATAIQRSVAERFGVRLEPEPRII